MKRQPVLKKKYYKTYHHNIRRTKQAIYKQSPLQILPIISVVLMLNILVWELVNLPSTDYQEWNGVIKGLSFSPYRDKYNPLEQDYPMAREIAEDVHLIAPHVGEIRTYSSLHGQENIPAYALKEGLRVTQGAWVGKPTDNNLFELQSLVKLANTYSNIHRVVVGNESLHRADETVDELIDMIRYVKNRVHVPVSTAEPWDIWIKNPSLVDEVDFITIHILPYWEGKPLDKALAYSMQRYNEVAKAFPGKPIVIGEIGWPSSGQWNYGAEPSQVNQAHFIRNFLNIANQRKLDYFIVEAFDQTWKSQIEGSVGANWGLWDRNGEAKFPLIGKIKESKQWTRDCAIAILSALLPLWLFMRNAKHLHLRGQLFYLSLIMAIISLLISSIVTAQHNAYTTSQSFAWSGLVLFQVFLFAVMLVDGLEFTEMLWTREWERSVTAIKGHQQYYPKVSIHIPCYNEPPQMVKATLDAIVAMNYPHYEVLVVDNNTKDAAVWEPIKYYCQQLGSAFRFFHLPQWPGFKAGALNFALSQTSRDAEIIAVIDSDYQVQPDWLISLVPVFAQPEVGFVQSPQDYRDWQDNHFKTMCYWEYAGFFHIGMVIRNERNSIIQHGTMTMIRSTALHQVKGWAQWSICEDAELGLKLFENKWQSYYINKSFGQGLIPDSFADYKSQRFRWAYGAMQIMKEHVAFFKLERKELTLAQKYHFIAGWLPWLADAANVVFVLGSLLWSILLLCKWVEFPPEVFLWPTLGVFLFKLASNFVIYAFKIKAKIKDILGATIASTALSHVVGLAILQGLFTCDKPFFRTPKCKNKPAWYQSFVMARDEWLLLLALLLCGLGVIVKYTGENKQATLWTGMLTVESLPYLSAIIMSFINVWQPAQKK